MMNYLNILEVWDIIQRESESKYNFTTFNLTIETGIEKDQNIIV
jgi:hypothetical protein